MYKRGFISTALKLKHERFSLWTGRRQGIDYAPILGLDCKIVAQRRIPNEEVPAFLKPHGVEKVVMEASTGIALIYKRLTEEGYQVTVSHPQKTRYIAKARIKSDRVDSKALAELLRLDSLPERIIPPEELAELREKFRRRAFLVWERTKLKVKIKGVLAYGDIKPPKGHGLFIRKGVQWLRDLGLESVDSYLWLMVPLSREVLLLSKELRGLARDDPDIQHLMTVPGVGYYIALLIKAEIGDVSYRRLNHRPPGPTAPFPGDPAVPLHAPASPGATLAFIMLVSTMQISK